MTREEVIRIFRKEIECLSHTYCKDYILEKVCDPNTVPPNSEYIEAYGIAIKALEQERSRSAEITQYRHDCEKLMEENERLKKALEQEPCEDAISRQAVDEIKELMTDMNGDTVYAVRMSDTRQLLPVNPQEPVLDKIRAEIEQNAYPIVHGVNNHELGMTLYGILQIIDKYKAERSDNR